MTPDRELLRQYSATGSEAAFSELVRRYVGLAYSAALRQVGGDPALAEDVTQSVFVDLARKAPSLASHTTLAAWVHTSIRYAALQARRDRQLRQTREQEAAMQENLSKPEKDWNQLHPLLDEAVAQLDERDREAVLLRYFQGWTHREVAAALRLTEDAARMRVERALEKLRSHFARHGVTTTAALLASTLGAHGATPAPAVFAASVAGKSLATASTGTSSAFAGVRALFAAEKNVALLVVSIAAVMLIVAFWPKQINQPSPNKTLAAAPVPSITPAMVSPTPLLPPMNISPSLTQAVTAAVLLSIAPVAPAQNSPSATPSPPTASAAAPAVIAPVAAVASPVTISALVAANNQFAFDLYRLFDPKPGENAFFSPYSISTALAMTWVGANGQTADQMAKALHFTDHAPADVTPAIKALQQTLIQAETNTASQLSIANSLWAEQNPSQPFLQTYLDLAQNDFGSEVKFADFKNQAQAAIGQINNWVAEKTNNKITNVLRPEDVTELERRDELLGLVLVNAIYFKGGWAHTFSIPLTTQARFHLAEGGDKPVALMNSTFNADYADITDSVTPCQILSLNYAAQNQSDFPIRARGVGFGAAPTTAGGAGPGNVGLSFIVILPRTKEGLSALEKNLDTDQLATWIGKMTLNRMNVFLPKFKVEQSYDLNTGLQALGITDAFVNPFTHPNDPNSADFSGMNGVRQFFIAKAVHQTYLNVDEKGTEAAAATAIMVGAMGAGMPPKSVLFRADHPFLFIIRENSTGCILFLGRLASPP